MPISSTGSFQVFRKGLAEAARILDNRIALKYFCFACNEFEGLVNCIFKEEKKAKKQTNLSDARGYAPVEICTDIFRGCRTWLVRNNLKNHSICFDMHRKCL
jgi:hypothetical protein